MDNILFCFSKCYNFYCLWRDCWARDKTIEPVTWVTYVRSKTWKQCSHSDSLSHENSLFALFSIDWRLRLIAFRNGDHNCISILQICLSDGEENRAWILDRFRIELNDLYKTNTQINLTPIVQTKYKRKQKSLLNWVETSNCVRFALLCISMNISSIFQIWRSL